MPSLSEESAPEETSPEAVSQEASPEGFYIRPSQKAFDIPDHWPKWNKVCGAKLRKREGTCRKYAVVGCPRCKYHGSGGVRNKQIGQLRYLAWIICGGPQDIPVEHACTIALAVFTEQVFNQGAGTIDQQMKAAMWMTSLIEQP